MTEIQYATTQELMNELGRRLKRVVVVGAFMNEVNQEQTFLFTGPTTDLNTSLGMTVVNLFALRATDPAQLGKHADPFGPENAKHLTEQIIEHQQIGIIVAAWGANPMALRYESIGVLKMALRNAGALCLGMTAEGHPRHPLYVKNDQPLIPWTPSG